MLGTPEASADDRVGDPVKHTVSKGTGGKLIKWRIREVYMQ